MPDLIINRMVNLSPGRVAGPGFISRQDWNVISAKTEGSHYCRAYGKDGRWAIRISLVILGTATLSCVIATVKGYIPSSKSFIRTKSI
jgi:hypothetical protein